MQRERRQVRRPIRMAWSLQRNLDRGDVAKTPIFKLLKGKV